MPLPLGIDISSHQGSNLNFALMRAITAFVAIRSGISWGYKDPPPFMPRNWNGSWLIHQTAERGDGSLYGVKSYYVDLDRWNGTSEEVENYFGTALWTTSGTKQVYMEGFYEIP